MKFSDRMLSAVIGNGITLNGITLNGIKMNGITLNGLALESTFEVNRWMVPSALSQGSLGDENWINPDSLDASGVHGVLDNRHIPNDLKVALCESTEIRNYFETLIELAWPSDAEFHLCCGDIASECLEPDYIFSSKTGDDSTLTPPAFAPHFLTVLFGPGQQETLTAALIAKINTRGERLLMELAGRFDLGAAGMRFEPRQEFDDFHYELGQAWGNVFLDCATEDGTAGANATDVLCEASLEKDRTIGRDSAHHPYPMFTCSGRDSERYPIEESGKSCFSQDMATNAEDGCDLVAAVGPCDTVCVGGFCGVNQPPLPGRGTTNVMYVYMKEFDEQDGGDDSGLKVVLPVAVAVVLLLIGAIIFKARANKPKTSNRGSVAPSRNKEEVAEKIDEAGI